jgi:hypothetical protein
MYLQNNKVKFANADKLDDSNIYNTLAKRIYSIRNSLVHSKEGEKPIFEPFSKHEEELRKEIPLIKLLSEQIIIKSSDII